MNSDIISRYTPSIMSYETLKAIYVQRQDLPTLEELVDKVKSSIIKKTNRHILFNGERGTGKTYMISMLYYKIKEIKELENSLRIVWLKEEEWGITEYIDFLLSILKAFKISSPEHYNDEIDNEIKQLYKAPIEDRVYNAEQILKRITADKTIILIMENLQDIMLELGKEGCLKWKKYLAENKNIMILATAIISKDNQCEGDEGDDTFISSFDFEEIFIGDFDEQSVHQLFLNIAKLKNIKNLEEKLKSDIIKGKIETLYVMGSGNPRIYMILADLLTEENLNQLVILFLQILDILTPYYQELMRILPAQQRKLINELLDSDSPMTVREIAEKCMVTHQIASKQLGTLTKKGYLKVERHGRDSYYDLKDFLMRYCFELKKIHGEAKQVIINFLQLWFQPEELQNQLLEQKGSKIDLVFDVVSSISESCKELEANFSIINQSLRNESWKEVIETCESISKNNKNNPLLLYFESIAQWNEGRRDKAIDLINKAISKAKRQNIKLMILKAWYLQTDNRYIEMIEVIRECHEVLREDQRGNINQEMLTYLVVNLQRTISSILDERITVKIAKSYLDFWNYIIDNQLLDPKDSNIIFRSLIEASVNYKMAEKDKKKGVLFRLRQEERRILERIIEEVENQDNQEE